MEMQGGLTPQVSDGRDFGGTPSRSECLRAHAYPRTGESPPVRSTWLLGCAKQENIIAMFIMVVGKARVVVAPCIPLVLDRGLGSSTDSRLFLRHLVSVAKISEQGI